MKNLDITQFTDNFEKVVIFKTCTTIKNIYKTLDNYLVVLNLLTKPYHSLTELEIHAINKFNELFKLDKYTVEKIITKPRINGKRTCITKQVLNLIKERGIIKTFNHGTIRYKSGKNFSLSTKYTIDISVIKTYFNNEDVFNTNSNFYTKKQHKLIDKFILKYETKKTIKNSHKPKKQKNTIKHPENDIPLTNTTNTKIHEEKLNNNQNNNKLKHDIYDDLFVIQLQEFIDKKYITLKFAKTFLQQIGTSFSHLHEANGGTCKEELNTQTSKSERRNIIDYIIKNYKEQLNEDDYKKYVETYNLLGLTAIYKEHKPKNYKLTKLTKPITKHFTEKTANAWVNNLPKNELDKLLS